MEATDLGILALRIVAGAVMIAHGINHGRKLESTASWFGSIGFRRASLQAVLSSGAEVAIGSALIVGLLTPFAAAGLTATMVVAWVSNHRHAGFFVFNRPVEGWEYVMVLATIGLVIASLGPGEFALDTALGLDMAGWPGFFIGVGGIAAGFAQLAAFWRPPA
jgi:putative oxidoreductase